MNAGDLMWLMIRARGVPRERAPVVLLDSYVQKNGVKVWRAKAIEICADSLLQVGHVYTVAEGWLSPITPIEQLARAGENYENR